MQNSLLTALLDNAALLLALAVIYDFMTGGHHPQPGKRRQFFSGILLGCIGIGLVLAAMEVSPGMIVDMRSVLFSLCGFFFGFLPTLTAITISSSFLFYQSGMETLTGITEIVATAALGLAWRHLRNKKTDEPPLAKLFLFGAIVHLSYLMTTVDIQLHSVRELLSGTGALILLVGPVVTVLLGTLMTHRQRNFRIATALEESNTTYHGLFQNNQVPMLLINPENRTIRDANPAACHFYGWSREQLMDMNISQISTISEKETHQNIEDITHLKSQSFTFKHKLANGALRDVEIISGPITMNGQRLLYSIIHDITARKRADDERDQMLESAERARISLLSVIEDLKRTEARLELTQFTVDNLTDAAYWSKENGEIFYINKAASQALGHSKQDLLQMNIWDVFPDITQNNWPQFKDRIKDQQHVVCEQQNRRNDGSTFPVELKISYLTFEGRTVICGFAHDITERKLADAKLSRLSTAIEQSPETIVITDAEGVIQYVNPAFEAVSGYSRDEVLGKTPRLLKSGKHEDCFYGDLWKAISTGNIWKGRIINQRKNGEFYTEEVSIAPVRSADSAITGYVAVKKDITQELLREQQFHQSQKMEAVGQLAGGIAHDFNNILQAIMGFSEVLLFQLDDHSDEHSYVLEINNASKRAATLIKQLLTFSRSQPEEKDALDINASVRDTKGLLEVLMGKQINCVLELDPALHPVEADSSQISQIIMNLAVNSRDAMPKGGTLTIRTHNSVITEQGAKKIPGAIPGNFVCLSISDTGSGMNPETKNRLFEPFFTTKGIGKGTGLGLAVVYGVVQQSNGWIHVQSEENKGTSFKIYLPTKNTPVG